MATWISTEDQVSIDEAKPRPRVYLAASAAEIDRARKWRSAMADAGIEALATWIDLVTQVGESNPRDASVRDRARWSSGDLTELSTADVVWMLVPSTSRPIRGAWFEAGFAFACAKRVVFSGDTAQSVFCALGHEYSSDEEAFAAVRGLIGVQVGAA